MKIKRCPVKMQLMLDDVGPMFYNKLARKVKYKLSKLSVSLDSNCHFL